MASNVSEQYEQENRNEAQSHRCTNSVRHFDFRYSTNPSTDRS